jgi:hypothetical protein
VVTDEPVIVVTDEPVIVVTDKPVIVVTWVLWYLLQLYREQV